MAVVNVEKVFAWRNNTLLHLEADGEGPIALSDDKEWSPQGGRFGSRLRTVLIGIAPEYFTEEHGSPTIISKLECDDVKVEISRFYEETGCNSNMTVRVFKEQLSAEDAKTRDRCYDEGSLGWTDINQPVFAADLVKSIVIEHELSCMRMSDGSGEGVWVGERIVPVLKINKNDVGVKKACRYVLTAVLTGKPIDEVCGMKDLPVYFGDYGELAMSVFNPTAERAAQAAIQLRGAAEYMKQNRTDILFYAAQLANELRGGQTLDLLAEKLGEEGVDAMKVTAYRNDSYAENLRRIDERVRELPALDSALMDYAFSS
jgi:hypothetical protein